MARNTAMNRTSPLRSVVERREEGGAVIERLSCGHEQFAPPDDVEGRRTERRCWTCAA